MCVNRARKQANRACVYMFKAVATGTAGTAMAVPLLRPLHLNDFVFDK